MSSYKKEAYVYCTECQEQHTVKEVTFINIEEDFQGRDLLTFQCPYTSREQKSNVVIK